MFRILLLSLAAIVLSGCVTLDGAGERITQAQLQQLEYLKARDEREAQRSERVVAAFAPFAYDSDPVVRVVALHELSRALGAHQGSGAAVMTAAPPPQDGPILATVKALAPYIIPGAQMWLQDRQGKRSLEQAIVNMDLIGNLAGQIAKDPLVVRPDLHVVDREVPVILDREVPMIVNPVVIDREVFVGG